MEKRIASVRRSGDIELTRHILPDLIKSYLLQTAFYYNTHAFTLPDSLRCLFGCCRRCRWRWRRR